MNYSLLIQERSSARAFQEKRVSKEIIDMISAFHDNGCARLIPEIQTELYAADPDAKEKLEKAAGYNDFLIGAPQYLLLLSEDKENAGINAGYIMEDIVLKLEDEGLRSCFITFTDSNKIKNALSIESDKTVAAIVACGFPERVRKKIHLNIISMSNVGIKEKKQYFEPKKKLSELVYLDSYGNNEGLDDQLGFYDDVLWESFSAAAKSPSYMNRQPYSFIVKDWNIYLISEQDDVTGRIDRDLNLGIVMLHFAAVAQSYISSLKWQLISERSNSEKAECQPNMTAGSEHSDMAGIIESAGLPEGTEIIAGCRI